LGVVGGQLSATALTQLGPLSVFFGGLEVETTCGRDGFALPYVGRGDAGEHYERASDAQRLVGVLADEFCDLKNVRACKTRTGARGTSPGSRAFLHVARSSMIEAPSPQVTAPRKAVAKRSTTRVALGDADPSETASQR